MSAKWHEPIKFKRSLVGNGSTLRFELEGDPSIEKRLSDLVHDLKNAFVSFSGATEAIETGYRFDDETAEARLNSLKAGTKAISQAVSLLEAITRA